MNKFKTLVLLNDEKIIDGDVLSKSTMTLLGKLKIHKTMNLPNEVAELFEQQYEEFDDIEKKNILQKIIINIGTEIYQVKVVIEAKEVYTTEILNSLDEVYSLDREEFRLLLKERGKYLMLDYAPLPTSYAFFRLEYRTMPHITTKQVNDKVVLEILFNVELK